MNRNAPMTNVTVKNYTLRTDHGEVVIQAESLQAALQEAQKQGLPNARLIIVY